MSLQDSLHYLLIWDMLDGYGVELLTSDPSSLTPPLYNVFLLSLAVNVMSRCSHKSQVHENWSSIHNIFTLRNMKWVSCQNFRHNIKTKLVGKLLARLCCLLLRRGSEELLHLLGCCRNLAFDRWLEHGFRGPDTTNHQGKLFEIKGIWKGAWGDPRRAHATPCFMIPWPPKGCPPG